MKVMKKISPTTLLLLSVTVCILVACGGGSSDIQTPAASITPGPITTPDPAPIASPEIGLTKLTTQGTLWTDSQGEPITLKGTNLGNWLLMEFWMMNQSANTQATDQCSLEATLDERFGFVEREQLMDLFRDNWITERDWDVMARFGLNVIRLPFIWNLIEDENNPKTLRTDAWQYLDYAIDKAQEQGMYVILDLHGAVGAQGLQDHSGCAGQNQYWDNAEYQERTIWLWQQIAERYSDNGTVAAYGLLNEPWGTTADNLADVMITLYASVREKDADKIIILPGHNTGIDAYGQPSSFNGSNVAFDMHFYPGIFGWGEPDYQTHRDWLTCGENGNSGVCEWDARMQNISAPLLIGEFQPWANLGIEFGAKNARASYDKYASFNWATTSWSYKVLTGNGGQGQGTWAMVTNKESELGMITKSSTWTCPGWNGSFAQACEVPAKSFIPTIEGTQTYYLVIKFGACCDGLLDISVDNISLLDNTGAESVINGNFGSANNWTSWNASGAPIIDFNSSSQNMLPVGSEGPVLRMTGSADGDTSDINGGVYQAIALDGGKQYTFSGVFKDNGSSNSWAEFYLLTDKPVEGIDISDNENLPSVDFANAPISVIKDIFQLYGSVEYDIHQPLLNAMTADNNSTLYTLPSPPEGLTIFVDENGGNLSWRANDETDVVGYNVYRSNDNNFDYQLLAQKIEANQYLDTSTSDNGLYYYKVAAVDAEDISYLSQAVSMGNLVQTIPGLLQAENWVDMFGFQVETTTDMGAGLNIGFADLGDWLEYTVNVTQTGNYRIKYRLASQNGSDGFTLTLNENIIDTVAVAATGSWQTWLTQSNTVVLPVGQHTLRLDAIGGEWNLNWLEFTAVP
jgi:glucan 1,3-beta-glucosidase